VNVFGTFCTEEITTLNLNVTNANGGLTWKPKSSISREQAEFSEELLVAISNVQTASRKAHSSS
jgi:hypothetical protein